MVIWITGISGSGKTTLANEIAKTLKAEKSNVINVDGDIVRELFDNDLSYDLSSRVKQIERVQKLCLFLERQEAIVIASALYSSAELMQWNRKYFKEYIEIYLEASIELVKQRDVKGIYKKFEDGKEKNIVGIDIPWNIPLNYDLKINMNELPTIENSVDKILNKIAAYY